MSTVIVVADTVDRARAISHTLTTMSKTIPTSPRSIRDGAGRGFADVEAILVDDSAWPLPPDIADTLAAYCAPIITLEDR